MAWCERIAGRARDWHGECSTRSQQENVMPQPIEVQQSRPLDPPPERHASEIGRTVQSLDYVFCVLYALIGVEFLFELFASR